MKEVLIFLATSIIGITIGWCIGEFIIAPILFEKPEPISTFECPCEVDAIVTDVIKHTNKEGLTTVTTYVDVSNCVGVKN